MSRSRKNKSRLCKEITTHLKGNGNEPQPTDKDTLGADAYYKSENRKYKRRKSEPTQADIDNMMNELNGELK